VDAVIDKVDPTIDVPNRGKHVLAGMGTGNAGSVEDRVAVVGALLPLEACAAVLDLLVTSV